MNGRRRRVLSSVCALFMALLLMGQSVLGDCATALAAGELKKAGWDYGGDDNWAPTEKTITNIKLDKDTYIAGTDDRVVVTFNVRSLPGSGSMYIDDSLVFDLSLKDDSYVLASEKVPFEALQPGSNRVEIPISFPGDEEMFLTVHSEEYPVYYDNWIIGFNTKSQETVDREIQEQRDAEEAERERAKYVDQWNIREQVSGLTLDKTTFTTRAEQTLNIKFNVAHLPNPESLYYSSTDSILFYIGGAKYSVASVSGLDDDDDDYDYDDEDESALLDGSVKIPLSQLKLGENTLSMKVRFQEKGFYFLVISQQSEWEGGNGCSLESQKLTVKAMKDETGKVIDYETKVRTQYSVYTPSQAKKMKIFYSISDKTCDYILTIYRCSNKAGGYSLSGGAVAEFSTETDDLPIEEGKELCLELDKTKINLDLGVYMIDITNTTTGGEASGALFYVAPEQYTVQRDATQMNDDGKTPLVCDAKIRNFDLDKDEKYSFEFACPLNYRKYLDELDSNYDINGNPEDELREDNNPYLKDDYKVAMTVKYTPAGSKETRKLYTKTITGLYKPHTITLSSKEIKKKIYETNRNDISYAGVVTVQFTNNGTDYIQDMQNNAIMEFDESFKFSVNKTAKLTKLSTSSSKVELSYNERAYFKVNEKLGGKIVADIYKGSKKIKSVSDFCGLNSDGTASGEVGWNLTDSNNNYVETGEYTAKVHTVNQYTVYDESGDADDKTVKSEEKTITIKVVKPTRKLAISTSVSGLSGGNVIYIEKPTAYAVVKSNLGVSVTIKAKDSKGAELQTKSAILKKGQWAVSINLSGCRLKAGKYKISVTAETLDGQKKSSSASFHVRKLPKASIKNASLSLSNGVGNVSCSISECADVTILVKSGKSTKQTVLNQTYSAGCVKASFSYGGYKPGNYSVVIKTKNSGGSRSVTKTFTIKKKPVVVKKPTASGLSVRFGAAKDGDTVTGSFYYTGKNAQVVIDVMYVNTEEIVYTYRGKTTLDSGRFTWTWDGYKNNGFRCWAGDYIFRVYLVNSAGWTGYLRQTFTYGQG